MKSFTNQIKICCGRNRQWSIFDSDATRARHPSVNVSNNNSKVCWGFRLAGRFWIIFGLAGSVYYLINRWTDLGHGDIFTVLVPPAFFLILVFFAYGLSAARTWGKIGTAICLPVMILYLLDMLAMSAVYRQFDALFWIGCGAVLCGIYTLAIILCARKRSGQSWS